MLLNKDFKMQGGVRNYLGKTKEVTAPKYWKSSPSSPSTELAYITNKEKSLLLDANIHGSLKGKPNIGASGLLSFDGFGSTDPGQNRAGGDVSRDMDAGRDDSGSQSSGGGSTDAFQGQQSNQYNTAMSQSQQDRAVAKNIVDLVNSGVNVNDAISGKTSLERVLQSKSPFLTVNALKEVLSPFANAANKSRRTSWLEGTDKFGMPRSRDFYIANGRAFDPNATLVENTPEHDFLKDSGYFDSLKGPDSSSNDNNNFYDVPEDVKLVESSAANRIDSVAAKFFGNSANKFKFDFQNEYTKSLAKQKQILNSSSAIGQLAVNQSPFYNWLKERSLDKGIL
jgi:hypothetical protein